MRRRSARSSDASPRPLVTTRPKRRTSKPLRPARERLRHRPCGEEPFRAVWNPSRMPPPHTVRGTPNGIRTRVTALKVRAQLSLPVRQAPKVPTSWHHTAHAVRRRPRMSTTLMGILMGKIRRFEAKQRKDTYFRVNLDASRIERMRVQRFV